MAEKIEQLCKTIDAKLQLLKFTRSQSDTAVTDGNLTAMERLRNTLAKKVEEVHEIKVSVLELKFEAGEKEDEIQLWNKKIDADVGVFETTIVDLDARAMQSKSASLEAAKKAEEDHLAETRERKYEDELRFEREKLEQRLKYEKQIEDSRKDQNKNDKSINAKLPKLVITKFNGTHTDWLRFWNQFRAEIDSADVSPITKFSYLKELVDPKVRSSIDALPFNSEGYLRAKNILTTKYGKESEIINAHVTNIMSLPVIHGANPTKIMNFYETLLPNLQALETMGKIREVNGYVRMTLDKLEGIRGDLVRTDDNWQEWDFPFLLEALRKWTIRNPPKPIEERQGQDKLPPNKPFKPVLPKNRSYQTRQQDPKRRPCVYCDSANHPSVDCDKVTTLQERRRELNRRQLCFNCTGANHKAPECRCAACCKVCNRRHHTSICPGKVPEQPPEPMLVATGKGSVTYPVVVVDVGGIHCRALLDTGAGSSYASAALLHRLGKQPVRREYKRIEMMMQASNREIEIHDVVISSLTGEFQLRTEVTKVDRGTLLSLENPRYKHMIEQYDHLQGVSMDDVDEKEQLPVHLILGTNEYAQIKTETTPKIGKPGEPIAELTRLGWTIMSPGSESDLTNMFLTQTSSADYEALCKLDVLGLQDHPAGDQDIVYEEFKEQLARNPEGWYETGLLWKGNHPPLPNNKHGSLKRLENLVRKLEKQPQMLEKYDAIIQDQLTQGIVERVEEDPTGKEFYIPHKPVVRETAESTKIRIVYDASARAYDKAPSLNDCLETGPPLQNKLWSVLVRNRFHPVALAGDLKQAFLQVRIRNEDRDVMRFHWLKDLATKEVETLRFTRALFGLSTSPFLLGGVIDQHLKNFQNAYPREVEEIKRSLYVDDLISGDKTVADAQHLKQASQSIFRAGKFELHKWHSNVPALEQPTPQEETIEEQPTSHQIENQSYAKDQLGVKQGETRLLGVPWDKQEDTIQISFPAPIMKATKREVLGKIAKIYDPLGLASPITLEGKLLYREVCDTRIPWDQELPQGLETRWQTWENNLTDKVKVRRSVAEHQEEITSISLHAFGDASSQGVSAAVYAVTQQPTGASQGLVAAKSRLAKKGLTIPRLELVSGHMAANLVDNVKEALEGFPVEGVYCWLDSSVALHWIKGGGDYKQFVSNRVRKIQEKKYIQWRHVGTKENPADLGSRGGRIADCSDLWWHGPTWLPFPESWPTDVVTMPTNESRAEAKIIKEVLGVALKTDDDLDLMMHKYDLWKAIRICSWVVRFTRNCRSTPQERITGPITTEETTSQLQFWIRRSQVRSKGTTKFEGDQLQLNLQENADGILECRGRIQGEYPAYLPDDAVFAEKLVTHSHIQTLHGGVGLTMANVRERYWIPRLRSMTKRVIKRCYGCKRFQATAFTDPPPGNLPRDRTEGSSPFQVVGVDYAGPIKYRTSKNREGKAYILLYACSLTRAVYLELTKTLETEEFIATLKRLIARKGRPEKIYSDNGKTFVGAAKWLRTVTKDERLNDFLAKMNVKWQFNLSRAPWWGGQFERLVGLVKRVFYKTVGNGTLTWDELQDVLLDVEVTLNNRPLSYVEDDVQLPTLTPNLLQFGRPNLLPEAQSHHLPIPDLRKRARYLNRCKDALWGRWTSEYLRGLRERHNLKCKPSKKSIAKGDVMIIKGDEKNRGQWRLGIVEELIVGGDGVTRGARLRAGKSTLERPIQHLYPMELSCDRTADTPRAPLNVEAPAFRPTRDAAVAARARIQSITEDDQ